MSDIAPFAVVAVNGKVNTEALHSSLICGSEHDGLRYWTAFKVAP